MSVDTLSLARELRAADLAPPQAEAIAFAIGRAVTETAATKADLELLRLELRGEIKATAEALKSSLIMWFVGIQLTFAAVVVAAIKL